MMPQWVAVEVRRPDRRDVRIWVPVVPVALVFSPILLLAVLVAVVACIAYRISVVQAFGLSWGIVSALPGTRIDIEQGRSAVLVAIE
ncbi:MAG: hypothetical protein AB7U48_11345 [Bauldia sp.]